MAKSAKAEATPISTSYRVERIDTYGWQAYKVTSLSDNTIQEEPVFKEDVLQIVMNKIAKAMREEGQLNFLAAKKAANG